jgi:GalNAc5-diNAcBac-PP-undecaprenol beta-1,3-glucosyltransferase
MTLAATVVVPTHDHGPMLLRSVGSALTQTVEDLEVLVVGDGVPDVTREIVAELTASDERVRFFDNPKGPRHGEVHRDAALQHARGEIVCYLSDDDLWLPNHVEELRALLDEADFAHTLPSWIEVDGRPLMWPVDLARPFYREFLLNIENRVPLGCGGHRLELYRRLPAGWRTTPTGTPTDLYMWRQILSLPDCRAVSGFRVTVLHFPSPARAEWTLEERLVEMDAWAARLTDPRLESELAEALAGAARENVEWLDDLVMKLRGQVAEADADRVRLLSRIEQLDTLVRAASEERAWLSDRLDAVYAQLLDVNAQLRAVDADRLRLYERVKVLESSVTWRLRARLLGVPALAPLFRWAAKALTRPGAPEAAAPPSPAPKPAPSPRATGSRAPDRPSDSRARRSDPSTP